MDDPDAMALRGPRTPDIDRMAVQTYLTGVFLIHACEHLHQRGFTGAIGPEKAEELSGRNAEVDPVDSDEFSETARQALS